MDDGKTSSHKGERIQSYEVSFKLKVVQYAKEQGNNAASRYFKVDRKRVREWRGKEADLKLLPARRKKLKGGGQKINWPEIEEKLMTWLNRHREKGVRVTGKALKREALRLHKTEGNQGFKASCTWLRKFMKRHNISFRRATHVSQKCVSILDDKVQNFLKFVIRLRKRQNYDLSMIGNMDETPIWLDMPGDYTLDNIKKQRYRL